MHPVLWNPLWTLFLSHGRAEKWWKPLCSITFLLCHGRSLRMNTFFTCLSRSIQNFSGCIQTRFRAYSQKLVSTVTVVLMIIVITRRIFFINICIVEELVVRFLLYNDLLKRASQRTSKPFDLMVKVIDELCIFVHNACHMRFRTQITYEVPLHRFSNRENAPLISAPHFGLEIILP